MGELADSSLIAKKLCNSPLVTVAAPDYLKKYGLPAHPRDLRDHNYLIYSDGGRRAEIQFQEKGEPFFVRAEGNFKTNNSHHLRTEAFIRSAQRCIGQIRSTGHFVAQC